MAVRRGKKRQNITLKETNWEYVEKMVVKKNLTRNRWDKQATKSEYIEMLIENDKVIRKIEGKL